MRDNLILEAMHVFAWTAEYCGEWQAEESPLLLPGDVAINAAPHFAVWGEIQPNGFKRQWVWLFPDAVQPTHLSIIGHSPDFQNIGNTIGFQFLADAQNLIQATIPPTQGGVPKTKLVVIDPSDFTQIPNLRDEIEEVWIGFESDRLWQDKSLRASALDILSVDEFLDRLKRRII